jgi:hypothetical protein
MIRVMLQAEAPRDEATCIHQCSPCVSVWISPSIMSNHPGYTWRRVAQFCDVADILVLLRLSKAIYLFLVHRLYQDISVGRSARRMVHSLANNKRLPPMVCAAVRLSFVLELQTRWKLFASRNYGCLWMPRSGRQFSLLCHAFGIS